MRKFCAEKLAPHADEIDKTNEFPRMRVSCTDGLLYHVVSMPFMITVKHFDRLSPLAEVVNQSVGVDVLSSLVSDMCSRSFIHFFWFLSSGVLEGNGRDGTAWDHCSR